MEEAFAAIAWAVRDGDERATVSLVKRAIADGRPAHEILSSGLISGMQELGVRFKDGLAFLPEIMISARAMHMGLDALRPYLPTGGGEQKGTVVLGTVAGDLHDIGKTLVGMLLEGNGFTVVDLGVDVAAEQFVEAVRQHDADIVALSALLTTTTPGFALVIDALANAGIRDRVLVMVGGAPVSRALADDVGAEGFAEDCVSAVDEAERLVASRCVGT